MVQLLIFSLAWIMFKVICGVKSFNIDTTHPIVYEDPRANVSRNADSYFGYSVQFLLSKSIVPATKWILIGAPKSNSSYPGHDTMNEPGQVYRCSLGDVRQDQCQRIVLENKAENEKTAGNQPFRDRKHNSWLGGAIAVNNPKKGRVAICGHRWSNQIFPKQYLMNGLCYWSEHDVPIDSDFRKSVPLIHKDLQGKESYNYAYGLAGFSVHMAQLPNSINDEEMIIGAPGVYNWTGTVIRMRDVRSSSFDNGRRRIRQSTWPEFGDILVADASKISLLEPNSYFGYAIHSGMFFRDHKLFYVAGAPRGAQLRGKVLIFEFLPLTKSIDIRIEREGSQIGEYFGSAVLAIDLNNDLLDDLLVGAPFYNTQPDMIARSGDEGKVYVYLNRGDGVLEETESLVGSASQGARFGTTISSVGDIDMDGYRDVVVSAPYEDDGKGAIYLYLGGIQGIQLQPTNGYWQRISASSFPFITRGFGISISAADIDNNQYPDLVVGSYTSNQAIVLRTKPVIQLSLDISTSPARIDPLVGSTSLKVCTGYTAKSEEPVQICVTYTMQIDVYYPVPRITLILDGGQRNVSKLWTYTRMQRRGVRTCQSAVAKLTSKDFSHPITFRLTAQLRNSSNCSPLPTSPPGSRAIFIKERNRGNRAPDRFCSTCPMIDQKQLDYKENIVAIVTGCGDDNKCTADLDIQANFIGYSVLQFVIGSRKTIQLYVTVKNYKEPAYLPTLEVFVPDNVSFKRRASMCTKDKKGIICSLGTSLETFQTASIELELDVSRLESGEPDLVIWLRATTSGEIASDSIHRNNISLALPLRTDIDVGVTGNALREQITYLLPNETFEGSETVPFQHRYEVMNHGSSPLNKVRIDISVPANLKTARGIISLVDMITARAVQDEQIIVCTETSVDEGKNESQTDGTEVKKFRNKRQKTETPGNQLVWIGTMDILNCSMKNIECVQIKCFGGSIINGSSITMTVSGRILLKNAMEHFDRGELIISTNASAIVLSPKNAQSYPDQPDTATVTSILLPETKSLELAAWVTPTATGGGIILVACLVIILIKVGFFKRRRFMEEEIFDTPIPDSVASQPELQETQTTM